jgi:hypothetical protein
MATPAAPTNLVENTVNRTVGFTPNPSYLISDHEFSTNNGSTFSDCTSSTISLDSSFYNVHDIHIRVKAIGGDTASAELKNILAYYEDEVVKNNDAEVIDSVFAWGQSNVGNGGNLTGTLDATGYAYYVDSGVVTAYDTAYSDSAPYSGSPAYAIRNFNNSGRRTLFTAYSVGGSWLQDVPASGGINWSEAGNYRYTAMRLFAETINTIRTSPEYILNSTSAIPMIGEQDGNYDDFGTYTDEYISMAEMLYDIGINQTYACLVGDNVATSGKYDNIRGFQRDAVSQSNKISIGYELCENFVSWGWMNDDVHYEQQGVQEAGARNADIIGGYSFPVHTTTTTEIATTEHLKAHLQFNVNGENPVDSYNLVSGAVTIPSVDMLYGNALSINGTGAYVTIDKTPIQQDSYTIMFFIDQPTRSGGGNNSHMLGDLSNGLTTGFAFGSGSTNPFVRINNVQQFLPAAMDFVGDGTTHIAISVDFTDGAPHLKAYRDGVKEFDAAMSAGSGYTDWLKGTTLNKPFVIGGLDNSSVGSWDAKDSAFTMDEFKIYSHVLTDAEVATAANLTAYNAANTPVTPDTPVITEQNNDTNTFAWTATGTTELSTDNGSTWTDQTSPYDVGAVNIPAGELQVRVKAEGINPVSAAAASTIAFTEDDEINLVDIVLYSKDLDGIDTTSVKVKLIKDSVKYKNNVVLRSETLTYTPEGTKGKVTMQLPDTDNMEDSANQYYVVEFTDSAYKIQVPNSSPVDFWDLSPTKTKIRI